MSHSICTFLCTCASTPLTSQAAEIPLGMADAHDNKTPPHVKASCLGLVPAPLRCRASSPTARCYRHTLTTTVVLEDSVLAGTQSARGSVQRGGSYPGDSRTC